MLYASRKRTRPKAETVYKKTQKVRYILFWEVHEYSTRYDPATTRYGKGELRPPSGVQRCLPPSAFMDINEKKTDVIFHLSISMNQSPEGTFLGMFQRGEPRGLLKDLGGGFS
jgi:hypothetical protein